MRVNGVLRRSFIFVCFLLFDEVAIEFGGREVVDYLFFKFWGKTAA